MIFNGANVKKRRESVSVIGALKQDPYGPTLKLSGLRKASATDEDETFGRNFLLNGRCNSSFQVWLNIFSK